MNRLRVLVNNQQCSIKLKSTNKGRPSRPRCDSVLKEGPVQAFICSQRKTVPWLFNLKYYIEISVCVWKLLVHINFNLKTLKLAHQGIMKKSIRSSWTDYFSRGQTVNSSQVLSVDWEAKISVAGCILSDSIPVGGRAASERWVSAPEQAAGTALRISLSAAPWVCLDGSV